MQIESASSSSFPFIKSYQLPSTPSKTQKVWNTFKENIGSIIRDAFFMPLFGKLSVDSEKKLEKEALFFRDFWDLQKPTNPHLPYHEEIRKQFSCKKEKFPIKFHGKNLIVECSIVEAQKPSSKPAQNFVSLLGNLLTVENSATTIYPFLASYLEKAKHNPAISPLRIISISQYNTLEDGITYKPKTLDEAGEIFSNTLKQITKEKGPITQLAAHSLGTIILGAALKYATLEKDLLPLNLYFDRGPSSIEKASLRLGLVGWVAWQLSKFSGWDIDVGKEVQKYLSNRPGQNVVISEVINDFHFSTGSLYKSHNLQNLNANQGVYKLSFDFAEQLYDKKAHHNIHNGLLDGHHLVPRDPILLKNDENIADKIMKVFDRSLQQSWKSYFPALLKDYAMVTS